MILDEGTLSLENGSFLIELKENITLIKKSGPMYLNFDGYRPYSDAIFENVEINVNANIQCDNGYAYSSSKEKIFTWINEESWEIMQTYFPDAKEVKNAPKQQYAKNVHMFKMIAIKLTKVFISPQIMNIPFLHNIFMKTL